MFKSRGFCFISFLFLFYLQLNLTLLLCSNKERTDGHSIFHHHHYKMQGIFFFGGAGGSLRYKKLTKHLCPRMLLDFINSIIKTIKK